MKGQLPKAYLRMDPNIDAHPDLEAIVLLMVWANRQPHRGRFKVLDTLRKLLGKKRLQACLDRHDLEPQEDGRWLLVAWDEWQEGDLTVGERMHRLRRNKVTPVLRSDRNSAVTSPSPDRIAPSEALGVRRKERITTTETELRPSAAPPAEFPSKRAANVYHRHYPDGAPPGAMFKHLRPLVLKHGWEAVEPELDAYLTETEIQFQSWPKFAAGYGQWAKGNGSAMVRAGPQARPPTTAGEKSVQAAARYLERRSGGEG